MLGHAGVIDRFEWPIGSLVQVNTNEHDLNHLKVGLVVSIATPRSLMSLAGGIIEDWLWREMEFEDGVYIETAYIVRIGENETIYSYSELDLLCSSNGEE
tara:strand:+ start:73 stop:372 length:300 start_codon:yes stop_codon:yes gene_type:complete